MGHRRWGSNAWWKWRCKLMGQTAVARRFWNGDWPRFRAYWETYHQLMGREGMTPEAAKAVVPTSAKEIASRSLLVFKVISLSK